MCRVRLIGTAARVGVGAAAAAAVFLRPLRHAVAAAVGAVAVGAASNGAASNGAAVVGVAVAGVVVAGVVAVGNLWIKKVSCRETSFLDRQQRAVPPWVTTRRNSLTSPNKWGRTVQPQVWRLQCS